MRRRYYALRSLPVIVVFFFLACGGPGGGTVSGKVTYKGEPVTMGVVAFHRDDGQVDSGAIDAQGNYVVARAPIGSVKVTVTVTRPRSAKGTGMPPGPGQPAKEAFPKKFVKVDITPAPAGKYVKIPDKYKDKETSGLEYTVKSGKQEFNIELTD